MPRRIIYPSTEYLRAIFTYCPKSGTLRWNYRHDVGDNVNSRFEGKEAGSFSRNGLVIRINDISYSVHRIIYMMITGEELVEGEEIDHMDGNSFNNRWNNLRKATRLQNCVNRGVQINSLTGMKGIGLLPGGKYRARINGSHLGCFDTMEEAVEAYNKATVQIYGEFGRLSSLV